MSGNRADPYYQSPYKSGYKVVEKFGNNPSVAGALEDIWSAGGTYSGWLTAASAVRVRAGGDAADVDTTGAGARTIEVQGLDEDWLEATEVISLAGASASAATTTTFVRVFRAFVKTCGTYTDSNTAAILIETTAGTLVAQIDADYGQSEMCIYTIPENLVGFVLSMHMSVSDSGDGADVFLMTRANADTVAAPFEPARTRLSFFDVVNQANRDMLAGIRLASRTDVWARAIRSGVGTAPAVGVQLSIVLINEDHW